ncbi:hypothetical protein I4U23_023366 [Adineta vaga]|nr:hypothetical protein I4U23_023366 [Adineta vaga]
MEIGKVLSYIQITVLILIIILCLIYCISVLLINRFHHRTHLFSFNVGLSTILCCSYWTFVYIITRINPRYFYSIKLCVFTLYGETMFTLQVPLSLIIVSINRLCFIRYNIGIYFKQKYSIFISLISQWMIGIILPLVLLIRDRTNCFVPTWMRYYTFIIMIILPLCLSIIINSIIFVHVRSSTNRIHTEITPVSNQQRISRRDIHLLRHMILMLLVFVIGWCPIYIISILLNYMTLN